MTGDKTTNASTRAIIGTFVDVVTNLTWILSRLKSVTADPRKLQGSRFFGQPKFYSKQD